MDYIILDIEFNGRKFASDKPMEVIEIGAVRLDADLRQVDEFSALIRPIYFSKLNSFIQKKTGIPQEAINRAHRFPKVAADFIDWLKKSEEFVIVTWGGEDLKRIILDTRMHNLDDSFWMGHAYFDLLKGYVRCMNLTNDVSVETALQELEIPASGSAHRALDDARMTSEVFCKIFDQLDFERRQQYKDLYTNAKERRLVRNAIQVMFSQKVNPEWDLLVEHFLAGKVPLDDMRKVEELQRYFAENCIQKRGTGA